MARQQGNISAKKVSTAKKIDPAPSQLNNTAEMRDWYQKNKKNIENYAAAMEGAKSLRDITKTSTKAVTAYSKDSLRTYLQNIGSNEKNLRNLSRYLYYRCHAYYRLIAYNANMFCLDARSVIPEYDMVAGVDTNAMLSSYQDTLNVLDKLNLQYEFLKAYTICFREDVFYGCAYYDEIGMFILPLDPDYCKISGIYNTGDFAFVMDMSYFRSRQTMLELWGEPFQSMYRAYESDTTMAILEDNYEIAPPHQALIPKDNGEFRTVYVNENIDRIFLSIVNDLLFELCPGMIHQSCIIN